MSSVELTCEDFEPHVGTDFIRPADQIAPEIRFRLIAAKPLAKAPRPGMRDQFMLSFLVDTQENWGQGTCRLVHPVMGEQDIFLVAAARTEAGVEYCATFT